MNVLIVGNGKVGSFQIRGRQLGVAIGAQVCGTKADLSEVDFRHVDLVIMVKRINQYAMTEIYRRGIPWAWDILDAWHQPSGNLWPRELALKWLRSELESLRPNAVVFPTRKMQEDAEFKGPSIALPHHAWPKYAPQKHAGPVTVGYEGADYLGSWRKRITKQCASRGWRFTENGDMRRADIGIALREASGYAARNWKSGVKLANIQALGIPAICSPEAGYRETGSGAEIFVETSNELAAAFDALADPERRREIGAVMRKAAPRLADVAKRYRDWLEGLDGCDVLS